jgi:hypothetical protein
MRVRKCLALLLLITLGPTLWGQTTQPTPSTKAVYFDTSTFPLWVRDLRRAEIVAFGVFPFAILFSGIGVDLYRYSTHGWNQRYAPWPLKPTDAAARTNDEMGLVIGIAAGVALTASLADFIINQVKRSKEKKAASSLPPGTPIIIREPLQGETREGTGEEAPQGRSP